MLGVPGPLRLTLAATVKHLREQRGLTQEQLAREIPYGIDAIRQFESVASSSRDLRLETVEQIARAYGVEDPVQLLDGSLLPAPQATVLRAARTGAAPPAARAVKRSRRPRP